MLLVHSQADIFVGYGSTVDIPLAAWAAADTSRLFPAVKAGVNMSAEKADCFSGDCQFNSLSESNAPCWVSSLRVSIIPLRRISASFESSCA
jgi:hypothetical protein